MNLAWQIERAAGSTAFLLLSATVVVGMLMSGRLRSQRWPRFAIEDVHRFANRLTWTFIAIHVLVLLADHFVRFSPAALVVPGLAPYRPLATALGIVAMELLAALAVTNLLRKRLPHRTWRRLHTLNFVVWGLALLHGLTAGSDTRSPWALALYSTSAVAVYCTTAWRLRATARLAA